MSEWNGDWIFLEELEFEARMRLSEKVDLYSAARKKNRDKAFAQHLLLWRARGLESLDDNQG
jgi:hypothetical protein